MTTTCYIVTVTWSGTVNKGYYTVLLKRNLSPLVSFLSRRESRLAIQDCLSHLSKTMSWVLREPTKRTSSEGLLE